MPLPAYSATARVIYETPQKETLINVLWYIGTGPGTNEAETAQELADAIDALTGPALVGVLTTSCRYLGTSVALNNQGNVFTATSVGSAALGSVTGDELPSFSALVIQKRTAIPGREGRGRWYIGAVPEIFTDEGRLGTGNIGVYNDLAATLQWQHVLPNSGTQWTAAHYSKKDDNLYQITNVNVVTFLGTQRRRRLRSPI